MALDIKGVVRQFIIENDGKKKTLDDPNPDFSPEEVMQFYSGAYPELTTATIAGPEMKGSVASYEFKGTFGEKG